MVDHDRGARELDLVVWGATGVTGQLVAEHLLRRYGVKRSLRWAIAGRDSEKLNSVKDRLVDIAAEAASVPVILASANDSAMLRSMARRAAVVCSLVGPYARWGNALVDACVEERTDYCDITGEVQWIRRMIDAHHETASQRRIRIVHCCGFDSIPSDLGCWLVQQQMQSRHGTRCSEVAFYMFGARGGFSGGTVASMLNVLEEASKSRKVRRVLADPYSLNPELSARGPDGPDLMRARYDADLRRWTGPFAMASINTRVVRRTNALLNAAYGEDFRYREVTVARRGWRGLPHAVMLSASGGVFATVAKVAPLRRLMRQWLPKPGEGPSAEQRAAGYFNAELHGRSVPTLGGRVHRLRAVVRASRDPGYGATSKMVAESAVCLAVDRDQLPERYGVLTPASAMAPPLVDRLQGAGIEMSVHNNGP